VLKLYIISCFWYFIADSTVMSISSLLAFTFDSVVGHKYTCCDMHNNGSGQYPSLSIGEIKKYALCVNSSNTV